MPVTPGKAQVRKERLGGGKKTLDRWPIYGNLAWCPARNLVLIA